MPARRADTPPATLSYCAAEVRRLDRDRYLTALFAPPERRESLMALYAFNVELARVREAVSEPMMGLVRLQWWRDAIASIYEGTPRRHGVLDALAPAVTAHDLPRAAFDRLIDAREQDVANEPLETMEALVGYAEGTSSTLLALAVAALSHSGVEQDAGIAEASRALGVAWALTGLLRAIPFHARGRRVYLPTALLERHGARRRDVLELRPSPALSEAVHEVVRLARTQLAAARRSRVPRAVLSPFLLAPLADLYLRRLGRARYNPFDPAVAEAPPGRVWRLLLPAATGRF